MVLALLLRNRSGQDAPAQDLVHHENHAHPSNHDHRVTCYLPAQIHHAKNHHGHRGHALAQSHYAAQYQTAQT